MIFRQTSYTSIPLSRKGPSRIIFFQRIAECVVPKPGITSPQGGDGRPIGVADLTRDASVTKRDCNLDTRSMEEYVHSLLERG